MKLSDLRAVERLARDRERVQELIATIKSGKECSFTIRAMGQEKALTEAACEGVSAHLERQLAMLEEVLADYGVTLE